jgi:hypothetical protein
MRLKLLYFAHQELNLIFVDVLDCHQAVLLLLYALELLLEDRNLASQDFIFLPDQLSVKLQLSEMILLFRQPMPVKLRINNSITSSE